MENLLEGKQTLNQATSIAIHDSIKLFMNTVSPKMLYAANYIITLSRKNSEMQANKCFFLHGTGETKNYST